MEAFHFFFDCPILLPEDFLSLDNHVHVWLKPDSCWGVFGAECPQFLSNIFIEVLEAGVLDADSIHNLLDFESAKAVPSPVAQFFELGVDLLLH